MIGLVGGLLLGSLPASSSSGDTDKKQPEGWVIGPFRRPRV